MVADNLIRKDDQSVHLFLLIGSNPIPNYVAANLLWQRDAVDASLHLVCSAITRPVAEKLVEELACKAQTAQFIQVEETEPYSVHQAVSSAAQPLQGSIGVHYTGGTKTMAVHTYQALKELERPCTFSYLDAGNLEMVIEREQGVSKRYPVGRAIPLTIEQMLHLHGYGFHLANKTQRFMEPEYKPEHPDFVRLWAQIGFDAIDRWIKEKCQENIGVRKDEFVTLPYSKLRSLPLPDQDEFAIMRSHWQREGVKTFEELAILWNMKGDKNHNGSNLANWLHTYWLEDYVLLCVQDIAPACNIHQSGKSLKPFDQLIPDSKFEFDVFAIQGFRLFGISCTTEEKIRVLKLKLFEARIRTSQIGGEESRTALVCNATNDPHSGCPMLKAQLKESWDIFSHRVEVIGKSDLKEDKLKQRLKLWFEGRV